MINDMWPEYAWPTERLAYMAREGIVLSVAGAHLNGHWATICHLPPQTNGVEMERKGLSIIYEGINTVVRFVL